MIRFLVIYIASLCIVRFFALADEENREKIWPTNVSTMMYAIFAAFAIDKYTSSDSIFTIISWMWFAIYLVVNATTDELSTVIYRIPHYITIAFALIGLAQYIREKSNTGFDKIYITGVLMYVILLVLAAVLRAYRAGDTWFFLTIGLFLLPHVEDSINLLILWMVSIALFIIGNAAKIKFDKKEEKGKGIPKFSISLHQPIGPYITLATLMFVANIWH